MAKQVFHGTHGKAHGGAVGYFLTGSVAHGKLMLEQDLPEELQPMGRTHSATGIHTAAVFICVFFFNHPDLFLTGNKLFFTELQND